MAQLHHPLKRFNIDTTDQPMRLSDFHDPDMDWLTQEAVCTQVDTELFFPEHGQQDWARAAKKICRDCPLQQPCLEYAMQHRMFGVWGGTSDIDRRRLGRRPKS